MAMRSRGCEEKRRLGTELAWAKAGPKHTPAAAVAHCSRKRLRVVNKPASLARPSFR